MIEPTKISLAGVVEMIFITYRDKYNLKNEAFSTIDCGLCKYPLSMLLYLDYAGNKIILSDSHDYNMNTPLNISDPDAFKTIEEHFDRHINEHHHE